MSSRISINDIIKECVKNPSKALETELESIPLALNRSSVNTSIRSRLSTSFSVHHNQNNENQYIGKSGVEEDNTNTSSIHNGKYLALSTQTSKSVVIKKERQGHKMLMRLWSAYTSALLTKLSACRHRSAIVCLPFGRFISDSTISPPLYFIPSNEILTRARLTSALDNYTRAPLLAALDMNNLIMVTGGTAAQNSGLGINFGKIGFSEIVNKIVKIAEKGKNMRLNFKAGNILIRSKRISFSPFPGILEGLEQIVPPLYLSQSLNPQAIVDLRSESTRLRRGGEQTIQSNRKRGPLESATPNLNQTFVHHPRASSTIRENLQNKSIDPGNQTLDIINFIPKARKELSEEHYEKTPIPYPFLAQFVRPPVIPPGKRMNINLDKQKVDQLSDLRIQIKGDKAEKIRLRKQEIEEEKNRTAPIADILIDANKYRYKQMRTRFKANLLENEGIANDFKLRKKLENSGLKEYRAYFPFVGGEQVTAFRNNTKHRLKGEYNDFLEDEEKVNTKAKRYYIKNHEIRRGKFSSYPNPNPSLSPELHKPSPQKSSNSEFQNKAFHKYEEHVRLKSLQTAKKLISWNDTFEEREKNEEVLRKVKAEELKKILDMQIENNNKSRAKGNDNSWGEFRIGQSEEDVMNSRNKQRQEMMVMLGKLNEQVKEKNENKKKRKKEEQSYINHVVNLDNQLQRKDSEKRLIAKYTKDNYARILKNQINVNAKKKKFDEMPSLDDSIAQNFDELYLF